ncbi:uncharacterized protein J4E84_007381 [Alternaria hordeiaustralica]|uniref:uncharacterized protein n=1 Tax=Alternaria hordeiaustralica TaxID=1187925 RepID=UPI0020C39258|nr:uncharacterized protein J4E84_007381 [Alternaria hordeiaustralica]KAI4681785.1 hypothetical protein J4E84_007381 [Alternaria hordeiaustralica]
MTPPANANERVIIAESGDVLLTLRNPGAPFAVWEREAEDDDAANESVIKEEGKEDADADQHPKVEGPPQKKRRMAERSRQGAEIQDNLGDDAERPCFVYQVSSQHLITASPKFKSEVMSWSENHKADDGFYHMEIADWDSEAFAILLNMLHLRFRQVPKMLSLELLAKVAKLVDYYQCWEAFDLIADVWVRHTRTICPLSDAYSRELILWMFVAWVFKVDTMFGSTTKLTLQLNDRPSIRDMDLGIPPGILHSIAATLPTVIVKVGAEGKEYILHTELLKHHSGYFRGALSGAFRETDDGIIPITDIDTDAFDAFVDWIYRGTIDISLRLGYPEAGKNPSVSSRTYILADRLLVPGLKSALMDDYFEFFLRPRPEVVIPRCRMIIELFGNLPEPDPLLRFVVDIWVTRKAVFYMPECEEAAALDLPQDFLVRLMLRMNELGETPPKLESFKREDYSEPVAINGAAAVAETVVVIVGPEEKRYTLHKRLLRHHSGYFRRVFVNGVNECRLHNTTSKGFDVFVDWIYETRLRPSVDTKGGEARSMLRAYLVAAGLSVGPLKKAVMDWMFHHLSSHRLRAWAVIWMFESLPNNDPLLQLIVDSFCVNNGVRKMDVESFAMIEDLPKEYLCRVLRKLHQLSELPEKNRVLAREDYSMVLCL